jgi:ribosomal protein S18 acetylase RimI-like enzyme
MNIWNTKPTRNKVNPKQSYSFWNKSLKNGNIRLINSKPPVNRQVMKPKPISKSYISKQHHKPNGIGYRIGMPVNLFGDKDGDGVANVFDCRPCNPRKQGKLVQNVPINKAPYVNVYHGTRGFLVEDIKEEGLKTKNVHRNFDVSKPGLIYLSPSKSVANQYANMTDSYPGRVRLLAVKLNKEEFEKSQKIADVESTDIRLRRAFHPDRKIEPMEYSELIIDKPIPPHRIKEIENIPVHIAKEKLKEEPRDRKAREEMPNQLFGDKDGDGVANVFDCNPNDAKKQGFLVRVKNTGAPKKYMPQVQSIVNRMTEERKIRDRLSDEIEHKFRNKPDTKVRHLKQLDHKAQPENVGFYDFTVIPGVKVEDHIHPTYRKQTPMQLIVEKEIRDGKIKEIVKGEVVTKQRGSKVVEIKSLYVLPEYRNQGLGKKVISSLFKNPNTEKIVGVSAVSSKGYWKKQGGISKGSIEEREAMEEHLQGVVNSNMSNMGMEPIPFKYLPEETKKFIKQTGEPFEISKKDFEYGEKIDGILTNSDSDVIDADLDNDLDKDDKEKE